jgi:hypothetical protein
MYNLAMVTKLTENHILDKVEEVMVLIPLNISEEMFLVSF